MSARQFWIYFRQRLTHPLTVFLFLVAMTAATVLALVLFGADGAWR